jgi:excisionase family DNA binding protein
MEGFMDIEVKDEHVTTDEKVDIPELCKRYGLKVSTTRRWTSERRFPVYKLGKKILISTKEFEIWLSQHRIAGVE